MAISLSRMQDLLGSNGRILMQMVLVFYPSVTLPYIVRTILLFNWVIEKVNHQMKCLQSWIVVVISKVQKPLMLYWQSTISPLLDRIMEKMSNVWEALKMYLQWKMGALRDLITKMMNHLSEALKNYLTNDAAMGHPVVKQIGNLALVLAKCLYLGSELQLKYDRCMVIAAHVYFICLILLRFPEHYSEKLKILCRRWGCTANSTSDFIWFLIALHFETYYDNSLENLLVAFCLTIFSLTLLVVLRPLTDSGFFGFIIGVVGSITHSRFGWKFPTLLVACICFLIFCLKRWLEKHWSDFEEALPVRPILSTTGVWISVTLLHSSWLLVWLIDLFFDVQQHLMGVIFSCLITDLSLTDIESFGFTLGFVGFITHDGFGLKFPNWIVACICFLTLRMRSWLAKHMSDFEGALPVRPISSTRGTCMFVSFLDRSWIYFWLRYSFIVSEQPLYKHRFISWVLGAILFSKINFWSLIRTEIFMDGPLLPYTRSPLRTQAADYRCMFYLLAFIAIGLLGTSVDWWGYTYLPMLPMTSIWGYELYMSMNYNI